MADPIPSRLPLSKVQDGEELIDRFGNVFRYSAEESQWINIGVQPNPGVVTDESKGLVSPAIYQKLAQIQQLIDDGVSFNRFKLETQQELDPYFYLFQSRDGLIKFTPDIQRLPEVLYVQSYATAAAVSGTNTVITTPFPLTEGELVGKTIRFLTGVHRREEYIVAANTASQITIGQPLSVASNDAFRVVDLSRTVKRLRFELDRGRLQEILTSECCVGPVGIQGPDGDPGKDGDPAAAEVFQIPGVQGQTLIIDAEVNTPIDTPISLRLYDADRVEQFDLRLSLDGELELTDSSEMWDLEESSIFVDYEASSSAFHAEVTIPGVPDLPSWRFKVRQVGPEGRRGPDGFSFFEISEQMMDDPSTVVTDALISLRKSNLNNTIFTKTGTVFEEICASNLGASEEFTINSDVTEARYVSLEVTTNRCKLMGSFLFTEPSFTAPELNLPIWTATRDCIDSRRYFEYKFEWYNQPETPPPFRVVPNQRPDEQCCADEFFYCPNVGDQPCGIEVISDPQPPERFGPVEPCPFDSPLAFELQSGGAVLPTLSNTDGPLNSTAKGLINGQPDYYSEKILATGENIPLVITFGENFEIVPQDHPSRISNPPVQITGTVTGPGVSPPTQQIFQIPGEMIFILSPGGSEVEYLLELSVNETNIEACAEYDITIEIPPPDDQTNVTGSDEDTGDTGTDEEPSGTDEAGGGDDSGKFQPGGQLFAPFPPDAVDPPEPEEPEPEEPAAILPCQIVAVDTPVDPPLEEGDAFALIGGYFTNVLGDNSPIITSVVMVDGEGNEIDCSFTVDNHAQITADVPVGLTDNPTDDGEYTIRIYAGDDLCDEATLLVNETAVFTPFVIDGFSNNEYGSGDSSDGQYTDINRLVGNFEANLSIQGDPGATDGQAMQITFLENPGYPFPFPGSHRLDWFSPLTSAVLDISGAADASVSIAAPVPASVTIVFFDGGGQSLTSPPLGFSGTGSFEELVSDMATWTDSGGFNFANIASWSFQFPNNMGDGTSLLIDNFFVVGASNPSFTLII